MIKINLLGKQKQQNTGASAGGLAGILAKLKLGNLNSPEGKEMGQKALALGLGLFIAYYIPMYIHDTKLAELEARMEVITKKSEALNKELVALKDVRRQMEELTKGLEELQRQLDIIEQLRAAKTFAFKLVDSVGQLIPRTAWLNHMEFNNASNLFIEGSAWEYYSVNDLVKALSDSPYFDAVTLRSIQTEDNRNLQWGVPPEIQKVKNFQLEMLVKDFLSKGKT